MSASRIGTLVLAAAVAWAFVSAPAPAHDHNPPRVVLRSPGDRQIVSPFTATWSHRQNNGDCVIVIGDKFESVYPRRAMLWRPRRKIHLRFFKRHQPRGLAIRMHVRLKDGYPRGRGRRADYRLRRARRAGRRIWIAGFHGRPDARRHLYLSVHVRYRDVEGCGGPQTLDLAYHLRRRTQHATSRVHFHIHPAWRGDVYKTKRRGWAAELAYQGAAPS